MDRLLQDVKYAGRVLLRDRGFTTHGRADARHLHRRQRRHLRHRQFGPAAAAAGAARRAARAHVQRLSGRRTRRAAGVDRRGRLLRPPARDRRSSRNRRSTTRAASPSVRTEARSVSPRCSARHRCCACSRCSRIRGRIFTEEDGEVGKTRKVVLTYDRWQQLFGGRDNAVGSDLRINGEPHTVVGVLPASFSFLEPDVKLWLPLAFTAEEQAPTIAGTATTGRTSARLKPAPPSNRRASRSTR